MSSKTVITHWGVVCANKTTVFACTAYTFYKNWEDSKINWEEDVNVDFKKLFCENYFDIRL